MGNKEDYSIYFRDESYYDPALFSKQGSKATNKGNKKKTVKAKKTTSPKQREGKSGENKESFIKRVKDFWTQKGNTHQKVIAAVCIVLVLALIGIGIFAWSKLSLIDTSGEDDFVAGDYDSDIDLSQMDSITDANSLNELLYKWATNGGEVMSSKHVKNVLLIGKDSKSSLADSMILVSVNEKTEQITLVSFYRDCYTYIHPEGKKGTFGKLNSAYSRGGAQGLMETLENNFKVEIDDYVMVDYSSFPKIIDALGGVDVNVTAKEASYLNSTWQNWTLTGNPVSYKTGINHLNGEKALMFCRIRKLDSDVGRTERQRRVITSIMTSFKTAGLSKINEAVNVLFPNVKTSMTRTEILSFAAEAVSGGWLGYSMTQATMPPDDMANGGYVGDQWVWIVDYEGSAYKLQMLLYGNSNIEMSADRISAISLKPTAVSTVASTTPVEESTTNSESTTAFVEEESTDVTESSTDEFGSIVTDESESTDTTDVSKDGDDDYGLGLGDILEDIFNDRFPNNSDNREPSNNEEETGTTKRSE